MNYLKDTAAKILKERFRAERNELPPHGSMKDFMKFAMSQESVYNCAEGMKRIQDTWYGYVGDVRLTELIKEYAITLANIQLDQY